MAATVLALNPGSSSMKASVRNPELALAMSFERIGSPDGSLTLTAGDESTTTPFSGGLGEAVDAVDAETTRRSLPPDAVAHRLVHGGPDHYRPTVVDDALLADLREVVPLAPLHLPGNLDSIGHARRAWPGVAHVACFDTGFHHDLPPASIRLPVATELAELGIRRYGFHGLSVQSVLDARPDVDQAVVAHLGSGCSVTAVAAGRPRHTTMSLTPTSGMMSGTRSGDLDPEIALLLIERYGYTVDRLRDVFDHRSGLAGIAGGRHDLRDLNDARDDGAALALDVFVAAAAMAIAACATALDRWDTLVFTGGVGEHDDRTRSRICARLTALRGVTASMDGVDDLRTSGVRVLVVPAAEDAVMDRLTRELLRL